MSEDVEVWTWEITENMTGAIPEEAKNVTKTGYILEYRYLSGADATTGFDFENTPISWDWADESGNVYFIAKWTAIEYKLTIDVDWTKTVITWYYGDQISKPANPTKNWYKFIGWKPEIPATIPAEDLEVKATWEKLGSSGWWGGSSKSSSDADTQKEDKTPTDSSAEPQNDNQNAQDSQQAEQASDKVYTASSASEWQNQWKTYSEEFQEAYNFAHSKWITTMPTIQSAQMDGKLTRIAMAKMLSYYAINVLWQKPDETRINKFNDISEKLDAQYDSGVTLAYQLWIMWINMPDNKFRPNDEVTRWEFGTALSRMIYKIADWKDKYYSTHLAKLMEEKIITNDDPKMKELRGYVMIMLMRSAK